MTALDRVPRTDRPVALEIEGLVKHYPVTKGAVIKRFEVVSAQKIEGRWFLKQMRVEEMDPATSKVKSRSYLEIKK